MKTKLKFGARVKMHREEIMKLSLISAAVDIGVNKATLSRVENGKTPDIFTLAKICWWMGFSIDQAVIDLMPIFPTNTTKENTNKESS